MIKFFRNIRQRLISENRFSKYLLYAIGEIVLVVFGILIALQINNWNEARKSHNELQLIIQNLDQEFKANQSELENVLALIDYTKTGGMDILSIVGKPNKEISEVQLNKTIEKTLFFPTWKPSNFTLDELKNTGKLALIKNDTLKKLLFKWEKQIEIIEEWNRRVEKSSQDIIDYIKANGSIRNINHKRIATDSSLLQVSNFPLLKDAKFENQIDEKVLYAQFMKNYFQEANVIIINILTEVTRE
ncbi:MAG: hypothetical protein CMC08_10180 [Flavobacteriaceae bacterium]|nr:hypothetical protein [Flavobacteriaceae bacterium]